MHGLKFRGRPPIHFADSVKEVIGLDNPYAKAIMDRSKPVDEALIDAVLGQSLFTWEGRNPAPALDPDGLFQGTDLDLLSFMMPMGERGAVIETPRYRNRRKIVKRENERKVGTNQFGPVTALISNKEVHSFSARIFDSTIAVRDPDTEKETLGAHRNYMLVDCDGHWYDGWDRIYWDPTAAENKFLTEKSLWTGNTVCFKYYVHPNRWQSVFGAPYLLLKMLVDRINDEAGYYRAQMKILEENGLTLPPGEKKPYVPPEYEGATKSIKVKALEAILDLPGFSGSYPSLPETTEGLVNAYRRQKYLTWTLKPQVQFVVRADETAYFKYGEDQVTHWMDKRTWKNWTPPRGRIVWRQMVLSPDVALRYRIREITQQVSAE